MGIHIMKKKAVALVLAASKISAVLAGCAAAAPATTEPAAEAVEEEAEAPAEEAEAAPAAEATGKTVGIAMPTQSLERWNRDGSYLKEQFESRGYATELVFSDNKIEQQVKDLENMIADEVDLLVIAAMTASPFPRFLQMRRMQASRLSHMTV